MTDLTAVLTVLNNEASAALTEAITRSADQSNHRGLFRVAGEAKKFAALVHEAEDFSRSSDVPAIQEAIASLLNRAAASADSAQFASSDVAWSSRATTCRAIVRGFGA